MGGSSKSSNRTTNNVTNYSLQGMESADNVVAGSNNNVTLTDNGAIEAAFGFGDSAIELSEKVIASNADVNKAALKANESVSKHAMDTTSNLAGQTVSFADNAIERGFDMSKNMVDQNTANAANTTLAIKELAKSLKSGGATDLINQSNRTVYTMGAVFSVVVLGMLLIMWSNKR